MANAGYQMPNTRNVSDFVESASMNLNEMKRRLDAKKQVNEDSNIDERERRALVYANPPNGMASVAVGEAESSSNQMNYDEEEKHLKALKALLVFLQETSQQIADPNVYGFQMTIVSQEECRIRIDPIMIQIP